jgi:hypothetical protein
VGFCKNRTKVETGLLVESRCFDIKFVIYTYFKVSSQKITSRHNIDPSTWGSKVDFRRKVQKSTFFQKKNFCTNLKYFFFNVDYKLIQRKKLC